MASLSTGALMAIFAAGAGATWVAGIFLSKATDALDDRLNLGSALGGMILLSIAGSLPELAITVSAAVNGHLDIAAGNLIGGIAIQTCVLIIADAAVKGKRPLTYLVGELMPVLEALLVAVVVGVVIMGALLPSTVAIAGVSPASVAIVVFWFGGIMLINRFRKVKRWKVDAEGSSPGRESVRDDHPTEAPPFDGKSTAVVAAVFAAASIVTLAAGVVLENSGNQLATDFGMTGVVFGATVLAAASALPEISTALAAIKLGDHALVMGDIFGGNAFQVCLFLVADLIAGSPVLPSAGKQNGWLAASGIVLTAVYATGLIVRPEKRRLKLGPDSWLVLLGYLLTVVGLLYVA